MNSNFNYPQERKSNEEEVDLYEILRIFKRRWRIILIFIIGSIVFSVPYSLTRQKIWEGRFKIVIENNTNTPKNIMGGNSSKVVGALIGNSFNLNSDLSTQVLILESPLILKPVFNYAKNLYKQNGESVENLTYEKWFKKSLNINLIEETSVLQIAYKDSYKENILPILNKISKSYQDYSKEDVEKTINSGITYAKKQLIEFKEKSILSNRKLDFYKMKYGLSSSSDNYSGSSSPNNYIKSITDLSELYSAGGITRGDNLQSFDSPLSKLALINQELFKRRQFFQESDKSIKDLLNEREQLIKYIETTANGLIALPNKKDLTKEEAQEIIIKYKELKREADRDLDIVNNLENSLIKLKMDKAKEGNPWKLISTPRIPDSPIAPKKKLIVGFSTIFGILLGIIFSILKDFISGKVYSIEKLKRSFPFPILHNVYSKDNLVIENHIKLLLNGPLKGYESIGLFCLGNINNAYLNTYTSLLKKNLNKKKLVFSKDFIDIIDCSSQILITEIGNVSNIELKIAQEQLSLKNNNLIGMIVIYPRV